MSREDDIAAFLQSTGWAVAQRTRLAGDASTRRYERLTRGGESAILMDQPPAVESQPCPPLATDRERAQLGYNALARLAAGRVNAFVDCARYLKSLGLSAPEIHADDAGHGLAVLEDLGDGLYARLIESGADEAPLYDAAIDVLVRLHDVTPPKTLPGGWPLLSYDELALKTAHDIFIEWMPQWAGCAAFSAASLKAWEKAWRPIRARGVDQASVFCHRDFHAENLIWLPERDGAARVGLLDFQDAVRAHPAWDLSMLLHDARRDVAPEREQAALARYLSHARLPDEADFLADYHALGALNIVRILGIFARLVKRDSKPRYEAFMPRLWRYLDTCLADPRLDRLADWFAANVPREMRR